MEKEKSEELIKLFTFYLHFVLIKAFILVLSLCFQSKHHQQKH
jgi:hypothetical protein